MMRADRRLARQRKGETLFIRLSVQPKIHKVHFGGLAYSFETRSEEEKETNCLQILRRNQLTGDVKRVTI